jgi:multiple sugar transport system ATP-binding protein
VCGTDGWTVPLSAANARRALAASRNEVVLGARHSAIHLYQQEVADAVPGRVYTVEPTGDITFAYVSLGSTALVVSVAPSIVLSPDCPVWLTFDQERLHLFDGTTQQALAAA